MELKTTDKYNCYVNYFYPKAKWLEENCLIGPHGYLDDITWDNVNDPLMQYNPNYNCVSRTYEGFNNVNEDLWNGLESPLYEKRDEDVKDRIALYKTDNWSRKMWFWVFLVHRATGSGFSGQEDHGYRNSLCTHFGKFDSFEDMFYLVEFWKSLKRPMFSSIGNIPPHPKPGYSIIDHLMKFGVKMCGELDVWLSLQETKPSIKETTDWLNEWNKRIGTKKWNFPYSMLAADIATYFPELVDDMSDLYCGRNAMLSLDMMFEKPKGLSKEKFYTVGLQKLTDVLGTSPMAHEDTLCIYKRFVDGVSRNGDYKTRYRFTDGEK